MITVEHLYPRGRGGKSRYGETVLACLRCNNEKGNRTLEEYRAAKEPDGGIFHGERVAT